MKSAKNEHYYTKHLNFYLNTNDINILKPSNIISRIRIGLFKVTA